MTPQFTNSVNSVKGVRRKIFTASVGAAATAEMLEFRMQKKLRKLRRDAGLTLVALAERVGTSAQQISRLEAGDRRLTPEWARRLAFAIGCPVSDLMAEVVGPNLGQFVEDPDELALLQFWRGLTDGQRLNAVFRLANPRDIDDISPHEIQPSSRKNP